MTGLIGRDQRLTWDNVDRYRMRTWQGQAHWAGTGPDNTTCRFCQHWGGAVRPEYYASTNMSRGSLKPMPCEMFRRLMQRNRDGKPIPHTAGACKYYEPAEKPPALTQGGLST